MTKGNGKDPDKIVEFRTLADRDRARKEKLKQEKKWQKQYKAENRNVPPFLNLGNIPLFTKIFTALLVLVNLLLFFDQNLKLQAIYNFGFIPAHFTSGQFSLFSLHTPFTHMLIHGGGMHLGFNAVMMVALGTFFERAYGTKPMIIFFTLCGLAGALTFLLFAPGSDTPMVGASGGISGLFAAILMMMQSEGRFGRLGGSPWKVILIWLGIMLLMGFLSGAHVAWQAHIGGFIVGAILYRGMQTGKIRL